MSEKFNPEQVGKRLRFARETLHLDVSNVAIILGVSRQAIQNWEAGKNGMTAYSLALFCSKLDVSSDFILGLKSLGGPK